MELHIKIKTLERRKVTFIFQGSIKKETISETSHSFISNFVPIEIFDHLVFNLYPKSLQHVREQESENAIE